MYLKVSETDKEKYQFLFDAPYSICYNKSTSKQRALFLCANSRRLLWRGRPVSGSFLLNRSRKTHKIQSGGAERMQTKITLACTECKQRNYNTLKNKKNTPDRLERKKYCRFCHKHTVHKETK